MRCSLGLVYVVRMGTKVPTYTDEWSYSGESRAIEEVESEGAIDIRDVSDIE